MIIRLGHKMMDAQELPMPSTLYICDEAGEKGFRVTANEQGELTISSFDHTEQSGSGSMVIQPNTANQITLIVK
jgi:hypothetical protein